MKVAEWKQNFLRGNKNRNGTDFFLVLKDSVSINTELSAIS